MGDCRRRHPVLVGWLQPGERFVRERPAWSGYTSDEIYGHGVVVEQHPDGATTVRYPGRNRVDVWPRGDG